MPWVNLSDKACDGLIAFAEDFDDPVINEIVERIKLNQEQEEAGGWAKEHAIRIYGNEDVDFDDNPSYSVSDEGVFVMAWVWVSNVENPDSASEES